MATAIKEKGKEVKGSGTEKEISNIATIIVTIIHQARPLAKASTISIQIISTRGAMRTLDIGLATTANGGAANGHMEMA